MSVSQHALLLPSTAINSLPWVTSSSRSSNPPWLLNLANEFFKHPCAYISALHVRRPVKFWCVAQYSWTDVSWASRWEHGSSPMSSQASLNEQTRVQPFTHNMEMCSTHGRMMHMFTLCFLMLPLWVESTRDMGALQVWHTLTVRLAHFAAGVPLPTSPPVRLSGSYFLSGYFSDFKTRVNLMLLNVNDLVTICER